MSKTSITVLGLGRMGAAIAEVFLRNGHPTAVWNRTPDKAIHLDELGARRAKSVADAVAAGELIVTVLADTAAAGDQLVPLGAALSGRTVLNLATGRPDTARELADRLAAHGARFLDGGIFGVPQTVGTPDTLIVYSGAAEAEFADVIRELGATKYVGGDAGLAALHDMAVLGGMYGLFGGFFQATAMVHSEQVSAVDFTDTFLVPWLRALLDMLPTLAAEIDSREFPVNFSDLAVNATGLADIRTTSRNQGVATDLLDPLQRLFDAEVERGHGTASFTRAFAGLLDAPVPSGS
ncbi:NAD(P)-dependent oxidoreductase [Nocardia lijiangensis]|uniref:NAD(P)-dependent oxidoreductase n=1 Tax=Nocardia lijiangensis TaxID=299618 RepID=UPI003D72E668